MKRIFRLLILLMVSLLALSAFVACSKEEEIDDSAMDFGEMDEFFPDIERNDYNEDFNMFLAPSTTVDLYYMDDETNDGSAMDESVFQRQERVQRYLGIEIVRVSIPDAKFDTYNTYVQTAVQSMDGTMDMVMTHVHGAVGSLISDNLLRDLGEFEGIDLDAPYWNMEFMDTLELNGNYFLGLSDYNLLNTYVIAFNKDMLALYQSSLEKSVYDLVIDKEWTLDQMISLANLVSMDKTGNGKTKDDTFGIAGTCWVSFCGFLTSSDIPMMAQDQSGAYKVAISQSQYFEKADDLISILKDLGASNSAWFDYEYHTNSVPLTSGRTLLHISATGALTGYLNYDIEFGVLPYPMFDLDQASVGYKSLQWGGYIGVLSYLKNPIMVGEALELLAYYSESVKITYYEKLLGKRVADMPEDAAMLEIVWDSVTTDVGQTFITAGTTSSTGVCYTVPELLWPSSTNNLASYIKGKENTINTGFKKFLDQIG